MNSTQIQRHKARRLRILSLLCQGQNPKQIAVILGTSEYSIHQTICYMRQKENAQNTSELLYRKHDQIKAYLSDQGRRSVA